jgi:hypothetical protein
MHRSQVVVIKSKQGFADRLRVFNQALLYCLRYGACLCVDWEDSVWDCKFETIFGLVGVTYVHKSKVLSMIREGAPLESPWTLEDVEAPLNDKTMDSKYVGSYCNSEDAVRFKTTKPTAEILVTNGNGLALCEFPITCMTLRFKPDVRELIKQHIPSNPYAMVHLRGTDRANETFFNQMKTNFGLLTITKPIYVIGDNEQMINEWIEQFPFCIPFRPQSSIMKLKNLPSHLLTAEELNSFGLTKRDLHVETLIDFFGLIGASERIGMKGSYFFDTACALGNEWWEKMLD